MPRASADYNLATENPELAKEWHPTKNGELTPEQVTPGSNKTAWWVCDKGHEWEATIGSRTSSNRGSRCPVCISLAVVNPAVADEWHPTKNGTLLPSDVMPGTVRKVWWKCSNGHEWRAPVDSRNRGTGCPSCPRKIHPSESLLQVNPSLAKHWDQDKNGPLTPDQVKPGSNRKVWWRCDDGHEWEDTVTYAGRSSTPCPYCSGRKAWSGNNLEVTHPDLAGQWSHNRNGETTPKDVLAGTNKKYWWVCDAGHEWEASVSKRQLGQGCPYCSGKRVGQGNSLKDVHPGLAAEWHQQRNTDLAPEEVTPGSNKRVWWQCKAGHEWEAPVSKRSAGESCPYCSGQRVGQGNSLKDLNPKLAEEWHSRRNTKLRPEGVTPGSNRRVWWQCKAGHEWEATVGSRVRGNGCPYCSGTKASLSHNLLSSRPLVAAMWHPHKNATAPTQVLPYSKQVVWWMCPEGHEWEAPINMLNDESPCRRCRSLRATHPDLANEWHEAKNGSLTPDLVSPGSGQPVWWRCEEGHEWEAAIYSRSGGSGCPICAPGWDIRSLRYFVESLLPFVDSMDPAELYAICRQKGIFSITGKGAKLGEKIGTGKIPKEEFEKFAEGKKSDLDKYFDSEGLVDQAEGAAGEEGKAGAEPTLTDSDIPAEEDWIEGQSGGKGKEAEKEGKMPQVSAGNALAAVNGLTALVDQEVAEYLVASALHKIWRHAFRDEQAALKEVEAYKGEKDSYGARVQQEFLAQYQAAKNLELPKGYNFKDPSGKPIEPNLMQRLVASRVRDEGRIGNWSGTGAGKTLSAILASRASDCRVNIVCCPNSVVNGWARTIKEVFPDSEVQVKDLRAPQGAKGRRRAKNKPPLWLVVNYETFQQAGAPEEVRELLDGPLIDLVVIDEIHYTKQRSADKMSLRKQMVAALLSGAQAKNPKLRVLGMSATPVINNLQEGKSLVEMIDGLEHEELITRATVPNAMALHQALSRLGLRWMPQYDPEYERIEVEVDCGDYVEELKSDAAQSPMAMERILTEARLSVIRKWIQPKTLIYTHYIGGSDGRIDQILIDALKEDGWSVGLYTGDDKSGLERFIEGDLDVLIGTSAIGTGVDGLQRVCSRLIFNALPWTNAEFEQIKGRIYRQGQGSGKVEIIIPKTHAEVNGQDWSSCEVKLKRLENKKTIADCAVDGVVPEEQLVSPEVATRRIREWLKRLDQGNVGTIERPRLEVPLPPPSSKKEEKRRASYGDFSKMNASWNRSKSTSTHDRLKEDPTEWQQYHTLYREARESWTTVPYEELIRWCRDRGPGMVIGDFGCGEALIAKELTPEGNVVHSFDHVAINDSVIACDIGEGVPLEDGQLDTALFSLSLMGANFTDYLREAHRCLHLDGNLWIVEASSRFSDLDAFCDGLHKLGFELVGEPEERGQFTFIRALKSGREPQAELKLKF